MKNSRFKHDCDDCIYLGQYNEFDLYFCPGTGEQYTETVIARYSDEGNDYHSGMEFATSGKIIQLVVAMERAIKKGLYIKPFVKMDKTTIQGIIDKSESPSDAILNLHKHLYSKKVWNRIEKLDGFGYTTLKTIQFICNQLGSKFEDQKENIAMLWLNHGFGVSNGMIDWKIQTPMIILKENKSC